MINRFLAILVLVVFVEIPLFGSADDGAAKRVMQAFGQRLLDGDFAVGEVFGDLYVKEYADVKKQSLWLNLIPELPRFDTEKQKYLSEFFYEFHYVDNSVPDIRRKAGITSFKRGSGEIDRVLFYMNPDYLQERLFKGQYISPLYPANYKYYNYAIDTAYVSNDGGVKVLFKGRFKNIKLLTSGWFVFDKDYSVRSMALEGWDEQSRFSVECNMGDEGLERFVVKNLSLCIDYDFAFNKVDISAECAYNYSTLSNELKDYETKSKYDVTGLLNSNWTNDSDVSYKEVLAERRTGPLSHADSAIYIKKGVIKLSHDTLPAMNKREDEGKSDKVLRWLWEVGDGMISSHYIDIGGNPLKVYPLINPSYLRYSTGKGVTYKFALNLRNNPRKYNAFYVKPMVGYSFKRKDFYWGLGGHYVFNPRRRCVLYVNASRENSIYRDIEVEKIKDLNFSQVRFSEMAFAYYRDTRFALNLQSELFNGFDAKAGATFYYRTLSGNAVGQVVDGETLQDKYKNFAVNMQLAWQPGMYHYYDGDRKVNLGSRKPRFSLNVEQGVRGPFESKSVYTRMEFDVQHQKRLSGHSKLYTRLGCGGYLYEKNTYFIDYAFLKDNILPLDDDDELSGVFHLLDSEWYNSANRYFRANASYVSSFIFINKVLPRVNIFKNEMLFFNMLFMSKLHPYTEWGYGGQTPYLNVGFFVGFENTRFYKVGFKVTVSLFED